MNKPTEILVSYDKITILTLKGENGLNILNYETINKLSEILSDLDQDNSIEALIITGYGNKAFCSGADINELSAMDENIIDFYVDKGTETFLQLEHFHAPVIAAINGYAFGAAFELLLTCDLRVMANNALIGQPAVRHGLIPPFGGLHRLPEIVGMGIAKEIIFASEELSAEECHRIGLVNKVCTFESLIENSIKIAERITRGKSYSLSTVKKLLNTNHTQDISNLEKIELSNCLKNEETKKQLLSFFEKNKLKNKNVVC